MPDPVATDAVIAAGVGAAGAMFGAGHIVLKDGMTRKQVWATMLAACPLGSFVPAGLVRYVDLPWGVAGLIGLSLGLGCIPIVSGIRKLTGKFAEKPGEIVGAVIPNQALRDAIKDDPPAGTGGK